MFRELFYFHSSLIFVRSSKFCENNCSVLRVCEKLFISLLHKNNTILKLTIMKNANLEIEILGVQTIFKNSFMGSVKINGLVHSGEFSFIEEYNGHEVNWLDYDLDSFVDPKNK